MSKFGFHQFIAGQKASRQRRLDAAQSPDERRQQKAQQTAERMAKLMESRILPVVMEFKTAMEDHGAQVHIEAKHVDKHRTQEGYG
ncbi:hypothetical protein FHS85_005337 [Rhodoligotrophos appendicifer]|uniref:hypothetical protein n=1 Tax=Rhodoligotrophos appendicifer TaxID=987056 RepID=UPI001184A40C|nr:hypothetical protein [Rhodoligotrophos appendicifer]